MNSGYIYIYISGFIGRDLLVKAGGVENVLRIILKLFIF